MEARVLIIEDEALIALHLEDLVLGAGHSVVGIAMDPIEARMLARREQPHFALVDMRLRHGSSGLDAAHHVLKESATRCIFISANLDPEMLAAARALAPLAFIGKPFLPCQVIDAINAAVAEIAARLVPAATVEPRVGCLGSSLIAVENVP